MRRALPIISPPCTLEGRGILGELSTQKLTFMEVKAVKICGKAFQRKGICMQKLSSVVCRGDPSMFGRSCSLICERKTT